MRVHIERIEVFRPMRAVWYRPVVDLPRYGAVVGPAVHSKSIAKKAAHLIRREVAA